MYFVNAKLIKSITLYYQYQGGNLMTYTVTFNPAIDYVVHIEKLDLGLVNRSNKEKFFFGGKGINVSIVLNNLGIETKALGFVGGFTGQAIEQGVSAMGVATDFIHLQTGNSRINIKIKSQLETDLNSQGPPIDQSALQQLFKKLDNINDGDTLVLAGSIPSSLPDSIYENILNSLKHKKIMVVVDATKDLLVNVLAYKPFMIKPNIHELEEIFSVKINSYDELLNYAAKLQNMGAKNVLVSQAGDGAVLLDQNRNVHKIGVAKGKVINSVGSGDSMVAGFIAGYAQTNDFNFALKMGTAAGSATAFSEGLGSKDKIIELLNQIE